MRHKWLWLALLWWVATVYALFFKPTGGTPPPFAHFDKVAHFGLFFGQFWLLAKIFLSRHKSVPYAALLLAALVWAASSEMLQATLTLNRQGDVWDAVADVLGAAGALWLTAQVERARHLSNKEDR